MEKEQFGSASLKYSKPGHEMSKSTVATDSRLKILGAMVVEAMASLRAGLVEANDYLDIMYFRHKMRFCVQIVAWEILDYDITVRPRPQSCQPSSASPSTAFAPPSRRMHAPHTHRPRCSIADHHRH
jgi:hypothetical protein